MVLFMVKGKDIRHRGRLQEPRRLHVPHGVLFLCVQNSARSQMAEAIAKKLFPPAVRVWSAGSRPAARVHALAVRAMNEIGIDISAQTTKGIADLPLGEVDTVITLCGEEVSVTLPGEKRRENWGLSDPASAPEPQLAAFREARDELQWRIQDLVASWAAGEEQAP